MSAGPQEYVLVVWTSEEPEDATILKIVGPMVSEDIDALELRWKEAGYTVEQVSLESDNIEPTFTYSVRLGGVNNPIELGTDPDKAAAAVQALLDTGKYANISTLKKGGGDTWKQSDWRLWAERYTT